MIFFEIYDKSFIISKEFKRAPIFWNLKFLKFFEILKAELLWEKIRKPPPAARRAAVKAELIMKKDLIARSAARRAAVKAELIWKKTRKPPERI